MKFIYFDVGGVLMKDFSKTDKWKKMLTDLKIDKEKWGDLNEKYDKFEKEVAVGRDIEEFVPVLVNEFGAVVSNNYSFNKDFVSRFEKNNGIWKIVKECRQKYKVGLLTGQYPNMLNLIKNAGLLLPINWDIVIDSSVVKVNKPNEEIYLLAQKEANVEPKEILFIDNVDKNLDVPKKLGWKTFLYDSSDYERSNEELREFFGRIL